MTLFNKYRSFGLAILLVFLALAPVLAQEMPVVFEGKIRNLGLAAEPGSTYYWKIFIDRTLTKEVSTEEAEFVAGHEGASVAVTWKKRGIYYFSATALGPTGCMNLKVGMLKVIPIEIEAIIAGATFTGACQQVKLDGSKSIGDIVKYEWSMVDQGGALTKATGVLTEFLLSPSYTGSLPADFRVNLLVTDRIGRTNSCIITIKVDLLPVAEINLSGKLEKDGSMMVDGSASIGTALNYKWYSTEGKVIGANNKPIANLSGAGIYTLEITDNHGCKSIKSFKFPLEIHYIMANPDYARTSWAKDTIIPVLNNDRSSVKLIAGTVRVTEPPLHGDVIVNADGTITYTPREKRPGRDEFSYMVCDEVNLCASAKVVVDLVDAGVTAPEGFSPNGDGENENFVFKGLKENYPKSQLYVFTRSGQLVYQNQQGYQNDWNGTTIKSTMTNLELVPTGTYYYVLKLGRLQVGDANRTLKGFVYIGY
jgi:gliding motility-associated-like protein